MMRNNILVLAVALLLSAGHVAAQTTTLRVDCIFSGNAEECSISLSSLSEAGPWAGRGKNMDTLLLRGNGQISLRDAESAGLLYVNSFSTLFQEWQNTEEATRTVKAFENVFLLPMPESDAVVRIELYDFRGRVSASLDFAVSPDDILIKRLEREAAPHRYIRRSGDITDKIDMAIVAEGYTMDEAGLFYEDAEKAVESIFSHSPFTELADRFNIVAVALPSAESGVSVPHDNVWKDTALGSHFDTFYTERYLTTLNLFKLHDSLSGIPYEHIIILVNTDSYGGGGIFNSYLLSSAHNEWTSPVIVHEFGHSPVHGILLSRHRTLGAQHHHAQGLLPEMAGHGRRRMHAREQGGAARRPRRLGGRRRLLQGWIIRRGGLPVRRGIPGIPGMPHENQRLALILPRMPEGDNGHY